MPNHCAKTVYKQCNVVRTTCGRLSTAVIQWASKHNLRWVKLYLSTYTTHLSTTALSTTLLRKTPQLRYCLYPVSTGPTIIIAKEIN